MANLAIKGHPTRGKEIIEILETEEDTDADERFGKEFETHLMHLMDAVENGIANSVLTSIRDNKPCVVF